MDEYKFEQYDDNHFDYVVDIGACIGDITVSCAKKNPDAKIVAYEPCSSSFEQLKKATVNLDNVSIFSEALGDGGHLYFKELDRIDRHMCVKEDTGGYQVQTRTLSEIFSISDIDTSKKVALKIDCEGGEEYLIDCRDSEKIMKECEHIGIEVHFPPAGDRNPWFNVLPRFEIYHSWINSVFENTHNIAYLYSSKRMGHGIYILEKK